ncbi:C40 family peptidase [Thermoactinospora rubra]|uniref:C40 family peptidase n=1 Tax=Thermoactinospora rubra TaxID=1088767 RepID=UPI000A0FB414|nr:C40 family peptidase [Thermoactinospora rubra]
MIAEAGLIKAIAAGGGLVSSIALIAGMTGGGQYAAVQADPAKLASAACAYVDRSPDAAKQVVKVSPRRLGLTAEQLKNARTIVSTAHDLGLPRRAAVIGVATALQESSLKNGVVGDNGKAFGIFQQHPEYGWGSRAQVTDPEYAARKFFSRLVKVEDWGSKPLTVVAQSVQRSAFPSAYAKHEGRAERIVEALGGGARTPAASSVSRDPVNLSAKDARTVRASLEAAIALGIPRSAVVADVTSGLQSGHLPSARRASGDSAALAEQIVNSAADRLCTELSKKIGEVLDPKTLEAISKSGRGAVALQAALKMIGVPYSWGGGGAGGPSLGIGRGARTRGFDCSGLAEYAWAKAGVKIGGHTSTQWNAGIRVPRSQLKPGDLIFFATNPRNPATIYHVAINIDGKRYVHAPYTGSTVQVGRWTSAQEAEFAGAVRPG